jgi:type I restriction enzyme M protein
VRINGETETRVVSRIFANSDFGFLKVTVERPLRLNFEATEERIARLDDQSAFASLATSKKRKDGRAVAREIAEGEQLQEAIRKLLRTIAGKGRYTDRTVFDADLTKAAKRAGIKLPAPVKKAIFAALGERDPEAAICRDSHGNPEPDSELRDTENIPLPKTFTTPEAFATALKRPENAAHRGAVLPMLFGPEKPNDHLVEAMKPAIDAYMSAEVLPHVPDAWVDYSKTRIGYEIPINRHFYVYKPPRHLQEIEKDITALEGEIAGLLKGLVA